MQRARNILIVDDDDDFRVLLRQLLEEEGCSVRDAADGRMALRLVHDRTPDLIVLDLMMPVMNGWDFYAEIQRTPSYVRIPVAILSGVARMRPFGTMHELHKPLDLPSLLGLLHAVAAPEESRRAVRVRPS